MRNRYFVVSILDFNPKRMTSKEASDRGIPEELFNFVGDHRQYPLNIARHLPKGVKWYDPKLPWYYQLTLEDEKKVNRLLEADVLILTGSGFSVYQLQEASSGLDSATIKYLDRAQEIVKQFILDGKWVFGICFGGQLAISTIGGEIGRLPKNHFGNTISEAGWLKHKITEDGRKDELFVTIKQGFGAPHLHNDYVKELPIEGQVVQIENENLRIHKSNVLVEKKGYKGRSGIENENVGYTHASLVEFENGARVYQVQFHPEMSSKDKANFLVRINPWIGEETEMGQDYYRSALVIPENADFSVSKVITEFVDKAKKHTMEKHDNYELDDMSRFKKYLIK